MALNNVTFILGQGGLGRPLTGSDFISGLVAYTANGNLPSGFSTSNRILQFFQVADAEAAGILDTHVGETPGTATLTVTADGATGDTVTLSVAEPLGVVVSLGKYVRASTDTTVTLVAAGIVALINSGTINHEYSAANAAGVITLTARPGLGVFVPVVTDTIVGTVAITVGTFSGGVASVNDVWHYHISEYFRIQPKGNLYFGLFAVPETYNFAELALVQSYARAQIRQFGVYKDSAAFSLADITAMDTALKGLVSAHKECVGWYSGDLSQVSDISTIGDLRTLTANTVSSVVSQDGAAAGANLFAAYGKSIGNVGCALGATSLAAVSEDIANPEDFNMTDGTENDVIAFANGVLMTDPSIVGTDPTNPDGLLTQINTYRHCFLRQFTGYAGSYWNDNHSAIIETSDYAYQNDNRTMQKATRGVYAALVPKLAVRFKLNADGTIPATSAAIFIRAAEAPLNQMIKDGDISAMAVIIDPTQNVGSTSVLIVQVQIIEDGVARNINVPIGYKQALS